MRKVYINITCRVILRVNEGVSLHDVIDEMNYDFSIADHSNTQAEIEDTQMLAWDIINSK